MYAGDAVPSLSVSPDTVSRVSTRVYLGVHAVRNIARTVRIRAEAEAALGSSIAANTRAFLRKGRYGTTRLSQRRARGPIRR